MVLRIVPTDDAPARVFQKMLFGKLDFVERELGVKIDISGDVSKVERDDFLFPMGYDKQREVEAAKCMKGFVFHGSKYDSYITDDYLDSLFGIWDVVFTLNKQILTQVGTGNLYYIGQLFDRADVLKTVTPQNDRDIFAVIPMRPDLDRQFQLSLVFAENFYRSHHERVKFLFPYSQKFVFVYKHLIPTGGDEFVKIVSKYADIHFDVRRPQFLEYLARAKHVINFGVSEGVNLALLEGATLGAKPIFPIRAEMREIFPVGGYEPYCFKDIIDSFDRPYEVNWDELNPDRVLERLIRGLKERWLKC